MADTVTNDQVRAARLIADLASKWGVPVPQTLREIARADLVVEPLPPRLKGHSAAPSS